jgi:septum formation protein
MTESVILASQSPFRKAQLEQLGWKFQAQYSLIDERSIEKSWTDDLRELPVHLSKKKAEAVAAGAPQALVIGSDQMLFFANKPLAKPQSRAECVDRLKTLQGQTHELLTGLCVLYKGQVKTSLTVARLQMASLTVDEIVRYVDQDQPLGCAGGYKIEEKGLLLFEAIKTKDHSSIIGLPVLSLVSILREWGISVL